MNNEKQHSEYKIIETVATPTFDGISVETHPEDQLGGGDTPFVPTPWKFYISPGQTERNGYICGTTRIDINGEVVLEIQGPQMNYAYVYKENGTVNYNFQLFESLIVNKLVPGFNQKTGAQIEKYGFMVVGSEAINLDDYLLINA